MSEKEPGKPKNGEILSDKLLNELTSILIQIRIEPEGSNLSNLKSKLDSLIEEKKIILKTVEEITGLTREKIDLIDPGLTKEIDDFIERIKKYDFANLEEMEEEIDNFITKTREKINKTLN